MRMRRIVSNYVLLSFLIAETNLKFKLGSGIMITVPIPKEHTASGGLMSLLYKVPVEKLGWNILANP